MLSCGGLGGLCPPRTESPLPRALPPGGGLGSFAPSGISVNYPCLASAAAVPCPQFFFVQIFSSEFFRQKFFVGIFSSEFFRQNFFVRIFSSEFFCRIFFVRIFFVRRRSVVRPSVVRPSVVRPSVVGRPSCWSTVVMADHHDDVGPS